MNHCSLLVFGSVAFCVALENVHVTVIDDRRDETYVQNVIQSVKWQKKKQNAKENCWLTCFGI